MIRLRTALEKEELRDAGTYPHSGNVALSSRIPADRGTEGVERMINKEFGLDITVLTRSQAELARVVRRHVPPATAGSLQLPFRFPGLGAPHLAA